MREIYSRSKKINKREISGRRVKGVAEGAVIGAAIGFGTNYWQQRNRIEQDIPLENGTLKGRLAHEVIIFEKMDKKELVIATAKGAATGAFERSWHSQPKEKQKSGLLPLAA